MHFIARMEENFARIEYDGMRDFDQLPQLRLAEIGQERDVRFQEGNVGCIHDRRQRAASRAARLSDLGLIGFASRRPATGQKRNSAPIRGPCAITSYLNRLIFSMELVPPLIRRVSRAGSSLVGW